jgi:hypothetical protein
MSVGILARDDGDRLSDSINECVTIIVGDLIFLRTCLAVRMEGMLRLRQSGRSDYPGEVADLMMEDPWRGDSGKEDRRCDQRKVDRSLHNPANILEVSFV